MCNRAGCKLPRSFSDRQQALELPGRLPSLRLLVQWMLAPAPEARPSAQELVKQVLLAGTTPPNRLQLQIPLRPSGLHGIVEGSNFSTSRLLMLFPMPIAGEQHAAAVQAERAGWQPGGRRPAA